MRIWGGTGLPSSLYESNIMDSPRNTLIRINEGCAQRIYHFRVDLEGKWHLFACSDAAEHSTGCGN